MNAPLLLLDDGGVGLILDPALSAGAGSTDGQVPGALVRAGLSDGQPIDPVPLPEIVCLATDNDLALSNPSNDLLL